ncbi:hypothetical protein GUY44_12160 [Pimelobacter simplex]|uniref:hypothetical protein n=1 Tax=Nocardioides simplex TaxID=2045 RepID=UPI001142AC0C|nr:hypothetical protein [Pimelobacter simplex]MCG8151237.1 hypothetical protein [Pimelobacter simplex]
MSTPQVLPHLSRQQKMRFRVIAMRAFGDRTGGKTFRALQRELPAPPMRTPAHSVNIVSKALTPPK